MATLASTLPRQHRLLQDLARGSVTWLDADRIAPASNGPHDVCLLRCAFWLALPCYRVSCVTVDGDSSWSGVDVPTVADRRKMACILATCNTEVCRMISANTVTLRSFMARNGLTCVNVADFLDVSAGTVWNWHSTAYPQTIPNYRRVLLELKIEKAAREAADE